MGSGSHFYKLFNFACINMEVTNAVDNYCGSQFHNHLTLPQSQVAITRHRYDTLLRLTDFSSSTCTPFTTSTLLVSIYMCIFFFARIHTWQVRQIQPTSAQPALQLNFSLSHWGNRATIFLVLFSSLYCHCTDFTTT